MSSCPSCQTFQQLPMSPQKPSPDDFHLIESFYLNMRNLSHWELSRSPVHAYKLDGLELPSLRELLVQYCDRLHRFRVPSMGKLKDIRLSIRPYLDGIEFPWVFESLGASSIVWCQPLRRLVYVGEAGHVFNESAIGLITSEVRLILSLSALNKLQSFSLSSCGQIDSNCRCVGIRATH